MKRVATDSVQKNYQTSLFAQSSETLLKTLLKTLFEKVLKLIKTFFSSNFFAFL